MRQRITPLVTFIYEATGQDSRCGIGLKALISDEDG